MKRKDSIYEKVNANAEAHEAMVKALSAKKVKRKIDHERITRVTSYMVLAVLVMELIAFGYALLLVTKL